jgi:hypothetical protein
MKEKVAIESTSPRRQYFCATVIAEQNGGQCLGDFAATGGNIAHSLSELMEEKKKETILFQISPFLGKYLPVQYIGEC